MIKEVLQSISENAEGAAITHHITVRFYFNGGEPDGYHLQDFRIGFNQPIDYKGQPQHEVIGGIISFVITQVPDDKINKWMSGSRDQRDGSFIFRQHGQKLLVIDFEDAYCIGYEKNIDFNKGLSTRITISSDLVSVDGIDLYNNWPKEK
jgi:hypothetical protein